MDFLEVQGGATTSMLINLKRIKIWLKHEAWTSLYIEVPAT